MTDLWEYEDGTTPFGHCGYFIRLRVLRLGFIGVCIGVLKTGNGCEALLSHALLYVPSSCFLDIFHTSMS